MRIVRRCLWIFLATTLALGQEGFLIETIEFQGLKYNSESVLRSALMLEEGTVYSEEDLRSAQYRLDSLRFVYHSDLALRKGSKRGAYKLEITIAETKRYFWVLDSEVLAFTGKDRLDDEIQKVDPSTGTTISGLALGRRWFPGKNGELNVFFPFSPGVSYSHYNLFNRRIVASLAFQAATGFGKNFSDHPEMGSLTSVDTKNAFGLTFSIGGLVRPNHWLNFNYKLNTGIITAVDPVGFDEQPHEDTNFRNHKSEFVWRWDQRDHPIFPVAGTLVKSGLFLDREFRDVANDDPLVPYDFMQVDSLYYYLEAERYWERTKDQTFALGLIARTGFHDTRVEVRPDFFFQTYDNYQSSKLRLKGLYARNLLERELWGKRFDFRMETEVTMEINRSSLENVLPDPDFERFKARFSLVGRDNFGLIRLSIVYRSTNEELWQ